MYWPKVEPMVTMEYWCKFKPLSWGSSSQSASAGLKANQNNKVDDIHVFQCITAAGDL